MDLAKYLEERLKKPFRYEVSKEEEKIIQFEGIETYIYRKLLSKKFRKTSVDEETRNQLQQAIRVNVENSRPIKFTYPFGGYKIWRVPTYPLVDWAEFFTIAYLCEYAAPILATYEPGVEIYLSSDDVVIELIDNYPRDVLDQYINSFKSLVNEFSNYFPDNLRVELKQVVPDYYSPKEYAVELGELYEDFKEKGFPKDEKAKQMRYFEFNFLRDGKVDLSAKSSAELDELWADLMFWSMGYLSLKRRREFVRGEDKVVLFSSPIPKAIDIGSTRVSKAKFWAGIGVLEEKEGKYYERVMSPRQWNKHEQEVDWASVDLLNLEGFAKVPVFHRRFDFVGDKG